MSMNSNMKMPLKVCFIGAGNVATHMAAAMQKAGFEIVGVHTRTPQSAEEFSLRYHCPIADSLVDMPDADLYVFSIKDDALSEVVTAFGHLHREGLCVHTAGSIPMSVFHGNVKHYGVLYPLQTFSKQRELNFSAVPLFVEADDTEDLQRLSSIAGLLSSTVIPLSSEQRRLLHLAAVFACNFSNHCFAIASEILNQAALPGQLLNPLIRETCAKLEQLPAVVGQTGPAVRYDQNVMANQLELLGDDELRKDIYRLMSQSIHEYALKSKH